MQSDVHSQHEVSRWRVFFVNLYIFSTDNFSFSSMQKVRNLYFLVFCYSYEDIFRVISLSIGLMHWFWLLWMTLKSQCDRWPVTCSRICLFGKIKNWAFTKYWLLMNRLKAGGLYFLKRTQKDPWFLWFFFTWIWPKTCRFVWFSHSWLWCLVYVWPVRR